MGRLAIVVATLALAACTPAAMPPAPPAPAAGAEPTLGEEQSPAPLRDERPLVLLLPSVNQSALETYQRDLGPLADYLLLARVVLGLPDHSDVEGVAPPSAIAARLLLEPHEWQVVDPAELRPDSMVVWPPEWGGGTISVALARERLAARALAHRRARWESPAPWPGFAVPLHGLDGEPAAWPNDGLAVVMHPLQILPEEAGMALAGLPWVALGEGALSGPWPSPGPWIGWVSLADLAAALPPDADTMPLLLWFEGGEVVRWKAGLPPLEWLEPWIS